MRRTNWTPRKSLIRSAAILGVLTLASATACSRSASPAAGGADQPVRLITASESFVFGDVYTALRGGIFEKEGVKIKYLPVVASTTLSTGALVSGDADVVCTAVVGPISAASQGRDVKLFAANVTGATNIVVISKSAAEKLAARGITPTSPIRDRVEGLRDLSLGGASAGGSLEANLKLLLSEFGLNPDRDVRLQNFQDYPAMLGAMSAGRLDGLILSPPEALQPVVEGNAIEWISGPKGEVKAWGEGVYTGCATTGRYAKSNPEVIAKFTTALETAQKQIADDPAAAKTALKTLYPDTDQALFDRSFEAVRPNFRGAQLKPDLVAASIEQYNRQAQDPTTMTPDGLILGGS